jgi:hypothetical protein
MVNWEVSEIMAEESVEENICIKERWNERRVEKTA